MKTTTIAASAVLLFFSVSAALLAAALDVEEAVEVNMMMRKAFVRDVQATCPNGQTCGGDETCCPVDGNSGGYMCCRTTNFPKDSCCAGACCLDDETCCFDEQGGECCLAQNTFCVQKAAGSQRPSRCCPHWTIGCESGSVGCCDPAQPWQWNLGSGHGRSTVILNQRQQQQQQQQQQKKQDQTQQQEKVQTPTLLPQAPTTVYALVVSGWRSQGKALVAVKIDTRTGTATETAVTGFRDDPAGESTREFLWDPKRRVFYYLDANFTANAGERPAKGRPVYLYTVDPERATATSAVVKGASDFPTGYAMSGTGADIIMATLRVEGGAGSSNVTGYNFYRLTPSTASAVLIGQAPRGASEDADKTFYSGYHRAATTTAASTTSAFRFGYRSVTTQTGQGLCATTITTAAATATTTSSVWVDEVTKGHDYFMTIDMMSPESNNINITNSSATTAAANNVFLSLAPSTSDAKRGLDVVRWGYPDDSIYGVVTSLGNAHPPSVQQLGDLGYLASAVSDTTYAAMVVIDGALGPVSDQWALALVDLNSGNHSVLPLSPRTVADTWSMAGLGF